MSSLKVCVRFDLLGRHSLEPLCYDLLHFTEDFLLQLENFVWVSIRRATRLSAVPKVYIMHTLLGVEIGCTLPWAA